MTRLQKRTSKAQSGIAALMIDRRGLNDEGVFHGENSNNLFLIGTSLWVFCY
jgi:hypothetical protein